MATYYSSHNAAGGGAGTNGDPFTLQELYDNTNAGDLGLVKATGTYAPSATIDIDNASATTTTNKAIIRGAASDGTDDGTVATIDGSGITTAVLFNMNVVGLSIQIEGLRLTGATSDAVLVTGSTNGAHITFCRCRIDNAADDGVEIQETTYPTITFINCEIDNNTTDGVKVNGSTRYSPVLLHCAVHHNGGSGIKTGGVSTVPGPTHLIGNLFYRNGSYGVEFLGLLPNIVIANNVFFTNTSGGILTHTSAYGITVINNIFRSNGGYGINTNTGSLRQFSLIDYNCFHNNTSGAMDLGSAPGANDVTSDPLFTTETDGSENFTLQSSSPCLNLGLQSAIGLG